MALAGLLSAAASVIPGGGAVSSIASAAGSVGSIGTKALSLVDPGKARDAARISRRDFFLNAAKAGSVTAARYLLAGAANVYTVKEKGEYSDGISELDNGGGKWSHPDAATAALWKETLAQARNLGPLWDDNAGAPNYPPLAQAIAVELGRALNVPANAANVNQVGAIQTWAQSYGYQIRQDTSQAVAQLAAGVGSSLSSSIAPDGSGNKSSVLLPTNKTTLVLVGIAILALLYFALRKH